MIGEGPWPPAGSSSPQGLLLLSCSVAGPVLLLSEQKAPDVAVAAEHRLSFHCLLRRQNWEKEWLTVRWFAIPVTGRYLIFMYRLESPRKVVQSQLLNSR